MGVSGGGKSVSGSAQAWAQPFAKQAAGQVQATYAQNQPAIQGMASQFQGMVPDLINKFQAGNPGVQAANSYVTDVLGGKYLNGNPYMQNMIDQTNRDVTNQVGASFGSRGSFGGTAWTQALSNGLANADNSIRYQNYGDEMNRMGSAAALAPQTAQANYVGLPEALQTAGVGAELPFTGTTAMSNSLGTLFNGGTQTQSNGIGGILQGIGSIGAAAAKFSDIRCKTNIEKVGELADGLGVYDFNYIWDENTRHRGVMAQEVEKLRPWALGPVTDGYMTVNYGDL